MLREREPCGIEFMGGCEVVHVAGAIRLYGIAVRHRGVGRRVPRDLPVVPKGRVFPKGRPPIDLKAIIG